MLNVELSRREALAGFAASGALAFLPTVAFAQAGTSPADAKSSALLDSIGENFLRLAPEAATQLGIDKGERAA